MPNCSSISGRHSLFAPPSASMKKPSDFGMSGANATRLTPLMRLTSNVAPTTSAPLLPADANASPLPSAKARRPTAIELCFLARVIAVGSSSIVMTSGQSMISKSETLTFSFSAAALIFFSSPVKTICTWSSSAARRQPFIISSGALSPPNASIMIRMFFPHFNIQLPAKAGFVRAFRFIKHGCSADKPL